MSAGPFYTLFNITRPLTQQFSFRSCSKTVPVCNLHGNIFVFRLFLQLSADNSLFQFPIADEPYISHFSSVLSLFLQTSMFSLVAHAAYCTVLINFTLILTSLLLSNNTSYNMHQHRCFCMILVPQQGGISCCLLNFVIDL